MDVKEYNQILLGEIPPPPKMYISKSKRKKNMKWFYFFLNIEQCALSYSDLRKRAFASNHTTAFVVY